MFKTLMQRPLDLEDPAVWPTRRVKRNGKKRRQPRELTQKVILQYLTEREGMITRHYQIAKKAGYRSHNNGGYYVAWKGLLDSGAVSNVGTIERPRWRVNHWKVTGSSMSNPQVVAASTRRARAVRTGKWAIGEDGLTIAQRAVFNYIQNHQNQPITQRLMSEEAGVPQGTVAPTLIRLIQKGKITRTETPHGLMYRVVGDKTPVPTPVPQAVIRDEFEELRAKAPAVVEPAKEPASHNAKTFVDLLDPLAWEYVKETQGATDLLGFMAWLKKR